MEPIQYEQRGYLKEDFRLFHLADSQREEIAYHYHTFHKVIILLAGQADYAIEGERYRLQPGDLVLVGRGSIHRPELTEGTFYERMILYISPEFLDRFRQEDCQLDRCFRQAQEEFCYVYRTGTADRLKELLLQLEQAQREGGFGAQLLSRALFLQLMVALNRAIDSSRSIPADSGDSKIVALLQYLNLHLTDPLSIDELASRFYVSKYHMMRKFKEETGYTIHNYISEKRLLLAQQLLNQGRSLTDACYESGYQDYSTFYRAYQQYFGHSPREARQMQPKEDDRVEIG